MYEAWEGRKDAAAPIVLTFLFLRDLSGFLMKRLFFFGFFVAIVRLVFIPSGHSDAYGVFFTRR